jgi:hypothetical protein
MLNKKRFLTEINKLTDLAVTTPTELAHHMEEMKKKCTFTVKHGNRTDKSFWNEGIDGMWKRKEEMLKIFVRSAKLEHYNLFCNLQTELNDEITKRRKKNKKELVEAITPDTPLAVV